MPEGKGSPLSPAQKEALAAGRLKAILACKEKGGALARMAEALEAKIIETETKGRIEMSERNKKADDVRSKFEATASELGAAMVERDVEIELLMNALVSDEHVLLIGPPGTAKSALLDALVDWLHCRKFSVLLNGQSTLSDIFGPVSLSAMKQDKHLRNTDGQLPTAEAAFIDEIFKGNSPVRNSILRAINERQYPKGDGSWEKIPLRICLGASNEWPKVEDEAEAIFDRFLFRKEVAHVTSSRGLAELMFGGDHKPVLSTSLHLEELDLAREESAKIEFSNEAKAAMLTITQELNREGVFPSGRRLVKAVRAAKSAAWLESSESVEPEHLAILSHALWSDPEKAIRAKAATTVLKHSNPSAARVQSRLDEAQQIIAGIATKQGDLPASRSAVNKLKEIARELAKEKSSKAKSAITKIEAEITNLKRLAVKDAIL